MNGIFFLSFLDPKHPTASVLALLLQIDVSREEGAEDRLSDMNLTGS